MRRSRQGLVPVKQGDIDIAVSSMQASGCRAATGYRILYLLRFSAYQNQQMRKKAKECSECAFPCGAIRWFNSF